MYDDGQDISLDGFYLRGETLGLLVGEQWESREVCAMFSPWGTWCWKKKMTNSGSGTAAAEAVACPRSGPRQRTAAASQEPDGPFGWSAPATKERRHKHTNTLTRRTNELLCVCADTQTLRCRRGKIHAFEKFVAKTVEAFNVEERVKHAAWQGEGRSAMQSDWKVQTELEVKYSRARLNVCLSFCIILFLLQLNTKMPFKIPIYPIHLNWFFSFLVDEEFSVRNSHKTAKKVKCVYCYCMSTTNTIPNLIM